MIALATTEESRVLLRRGRKPLVGYVSQRNTLAVSERDGRIVITTNAATRAGLIAMGLLFGPALASLLFVKRMPLFIELVVIATAIASTFVLVKTLFSPPRAVFQVEDRQSCLSLSWRGQAGLPVLHTSIETDVYTSNHERTIVPNAVLVVRTAQGDVRVCASPDTKLIESLAQRVAALSQKSTAWQVKK